MFDFLSTLGHLFRPQHSNRHRPRVLHPEAFIFYAALFIWVAGMLRWVAGQSTPLPNILGFSSSITPEQVIEQTNQTRRSRGLEPLVYSAQLTDAAAHKGADMLANQYWAHVSPTGKQPWAFMTEAGYRYRVAGENLARDFANTPDMIQAWFNSPTHRANLLNERYTEIGVAVVMGKLDGYETAVVVQMFGTPKAPEAVAPSGGDTLIGVVAGDPSVPTVDLPAGAAPAQVQTAPALPTFQPAVLASAVLPLGQLSEYRPLLSPRLILEVVAIAAVILLISALVCDWVWVHPTAKASRLVGHNLAHVLYLVTVAALIALGRSGTTF